MRSCISTGPRPATGQRAGRRPDLCAHRPMVRMSLRIEALEVPAQDVVTRDNVTVKVNAVIFFRFIDPRPAVLNTTS